MLLRSHFSPAAGGENELDRYITRVANRYGAGAEALTCESLQSIAEAALNEASTLPGLVALADRAAVAPELPGGACDAPAYQLAVLR